ncbi:Brix domain-containing 1 [Tubulinosema ratisbonensis]|uniref:Ribosome production factor 2 homolog n=1 Tax=Tubulinosema ratisbonensis TaxID=291195 RepID=A0A437ANI2_9MICR|nr:Brix domain-containing 1 [Tubulinosema ratisbonensis]
MINQKKLLLVYDTKDSLKLAKQITNLRKESKLIQQKIEDKEELLELVHKKSYKFYLSVQKKKKAFEIMVGRFYEDEEIDFIRFKVNEFKDVSQFDAISPECNLVYFLLFKNLNEREENLFLDLFGYKRRKISTEYLKYYLIISKENNIFTIKLNRICELSEEIGPRFILEMKDSFFCDDRLFEESFEVIKQGKVKNVKRNEFNDKVGRIYVEKENFKDIKFKRNKVYKEFNKES